MAPEAIRAHRLLGHAAPTSYAEFLRQRLEINYYAAACLMPLTQSLEFLRQAKDDRNIAIEDFRDAFGVTHEAAALRFTNLATEHLGITLHFLRVGGDGAISKAYENDGLPLPVDATGSIEGEWRQPLLRGAGLQYNRIVGNAQVPGQYNGVVIARINEDVALADFENSIVGLASQHVAVLAVRYGAQASRSSKAVGVASIGLPDRCR